tara:strand:- start:291 stop:473 length:183 start_codon:yes stop_codon:yes gene_type:complete
MNFGIPYRVRLSEKTIEEMEDILANDDGDRYGSISHFIRCAVIEKIRGEKNGKLHINSKR